MAGPDASSDEGRLLRRLRVAAGVVLLGLLVFLTVLDTLGRLLINPSFSVSDIIFESLLTALIIDLGLEVRSRLPFIGQ